MAATVLFRFLSLLVIASSLALCAPLERPVLAAGNSLEERNPLLVRAAARIGAQLLKDIYERVNDFRDDQHAAQESFVEGVVAQLKVLNPSKNVIMFHDQDSTVDFQGADHEHIEFELAFFSLTKGYETYVFDSGTFTLAGDGGTMNWLFMGNYMKDGDTVVFSPVNVESPPYVPEEPVLPPKTPERSPNAQDGNYFVNCQHSDGTVSSGVAYYSDIKPGENVNQQPNDYMDVTHGTLYNWEQTGSIKFATGVVVHWSVFGGSQELQVDSNAGSAGNGYKSFWVYKAAGDYLYSVDDWTCYAVYFAF